MTDNQRRQLVECIHTAQHLMNRKGLPFTVFESEQRDNYFQVSAGNYEHCKHSIVVFMPYSDKCTV